jgi:type IV secretion system protein VirB5
MQMNMRKIVFTAALVMAPAVTWAQIPTTDVAAIAQGMLNSIQQIAALQKQWDQLKANYDAVTGNRGMGNLSTSSIGDYLPSSGSSVYSNSSSSQQVLSQEQGKISGDANEYLRQEQQRKWQMAAAQKAQALQAYDGAQQRLKGLDTLARQVAQTQDPKGAAELQARISAEQGIVASESNKLQVMDSLAAADQRMSEQRQIDIHHQIFNPANTGMPAIK